MLVSGLASAGLIGSRICSRPRRDQTHRGLRECRRDGLSVWRVPVGPCPPPRSRRPPSPGRQDRRQPARVAPVPSPCHLPPALRRATPEAESHRPSAPSDVGPQGPPDSGTSPILRQAFRDGSADASPLFGPPSHDTAELSRHVAAGYIRCRVKLVSSH